MPDRLIREGRIVPDEFRTIALPEGADLAVVALPPGPIIVPRVLWVARRIELLARSEPIGVILHPSDVPSDLSADLPRLALIAVHFPKFTDGRGYSIAYQLRRRLGYRGELRAVGDVQRDQLFYLSRSGFDAFLLKEGHDARASLESLRPFSATYQVAADGRPPRFGRLAAAPDNAHG